MNKLQVDQLTREIITGSITQVMEGFLLDRKVQGVSPKTLRCYSQEMRYFYDYLAKSGVASIEEITADVIRKYLLQLAERRNPGGCHVSYRVIRTFTYWWEQETDGDYRSPIRKVKPPKVTATPLPGISPGEIGLMLQACTGELVARDRAIILMLFDTGARASEFVNLNLEDVNTVTGTVWIQSGKGGKSRAVYLGQKTRRALRRYLKTHSSLFPTSPLFVTDEGGRLTTSGLRQVLRRRSKQAGLSEPGAHDFRRAFAVAMLRNGCDLITLAQLMGHSSLEVLKRYLHLIDEDLEVAHARYGPVERMS